MIKIIHEYDNWLELHFFRVVKTFLGIEIKSYGLFTKPENAIEEYNRLTSR